jgi:hypothetical protein
MTYVDKISAQQACFGENVFRFLEVQDVLVIVLHCDHVPGTLEVMLPLFHHLHDGQEVVIECVIVLVSWRALSGVKIDWVKNLEAIKLIETVCNRKATCVSQENDLFGQVNALRNRYFLKGFLEFPECELGFSCPFQWDLIG